MAPSPPAGDYVLANFRYLAVYNELVARISQRQHTLTLFVGIFSGLITALILTRDIFRTDHASIVWLMAGFPMASIILTFLNFKYETLISILRSYLAELERVKEAHASLPSYNCDSGYMRRANRARYFHDLACGALLLAYNCAALGTYVSICGDAIAPYAGVIALVAGFALACFLAHLQLRRIYYLPSQSAPGTHSNG
ncbi:MAG: hypothetical protein ABIY63_06100 [Fibrobacteria bacterium]